MNFIQRAEHWGERHHSKWLDILRIALGIFLCYKGVDFLNNMSSMMTLMTGSTPFSEFMLLVIGHYVVFAHILGGFLIAIGVLTRFACLIQIPILIGAIIFVNSSADVMRPYSELFISILVLLLLVLFLIIGNGPWSASLLTDEDRNRK
jgi:putative oxidoreductase